LRRTGKKSVSSYLTTFAVLLSLWLIFVNTLNWQEVLTGIVLSALVAAFGHTYFTQQGLRHFSLKKLLYFIIYIPIFFWEILKANLDVAYRVLHPKMPIKPGIVLIKTALKSDTGKLALANSITLTPGTLTMDIIDDNLLIHWINVKSEDPEEATELIAGRFEPYLRGIFS